MYIHGYSSVKGLGRCVAYNTVIPMRKGEDDSTYLSKHIVKQTKAIGPLKMLMLTTFPSL